MRTLIERHGDRSVTRGHDLKVLRQKFGKNKHVALTMAADEIRNLLRGAAAAAVDARERAPAVPGHARADRAGGPARLRLRVGGGAPLPRGVLAHVGARG